MYTFSSLVPSLTFRRDPMRRGGLGATFACRDGKASPSTILNEDA